MVTWQRAPVLVQAPVHPVKVEPEDAWARMETEEFGLKGMVVEVQVTPQLIVPAALNTLPSPPPAFMTVRLYIVTFPGVMKDGSPSDVPRLRAWSLDFSLKW